MVHATFVMEQHLGHQTYAENLRRYVGEGRVRAAWVPVTYREPHPIWDRATLVPERLRGALRGRAHVRRSLAGADTDVLFFNTQVPAVLGGGLTRRRPYVISTDITPLQYDRMAEAYRHALDRPGPWRWYKHRRNAALLRNAARILPWSSWVSGSLVADYGVAPERIEVVAPGVDLARWAPGPPRRAGPLRILFVGGDLQRKGGEVLLEAFRALPKGSAHLTLVTRTRAVYPEGVRALHHLEPNAAELVSLYREADVFVLPSIAEAFGIAAVEASAAGLAVIATSVGGLTDIVRDDETGFLVPPGDAGAIAERLRALAADGDLRRRLGGGARERAERMFDARRNSARVVEVLTEVAAARAAR